MSSSLVIFLLLLVAIGSFFFGRWHGMSQRSKALSEELKAKEDELNHLKEDVNKHFDETARLFSNVTEEYKLLYQHLASSANKLGNRKFELKLSSNTSGLPGLNKQHTDELEESIIESKATEIEDFQAGPQQPRDYADDDMDDDYHPNHSQSDGNEELDKEPLSAVNEKGNSTSKEESEVSSDSSEKQSKPSKSA